MTQSCPTDEELSACIDGRANPARRAQLIAHVARCDSCFQLFVEAIRELSAPEPRHADDPEES